MRMDYNLRDSQCSIRLEEIKSVIRKILRNIAALDSNRSDSSSDYGGKILDNILEIVAERLKKFGADVHCLLMNITLHDLIGNLILFPMCSI